MFAGFYKNTWSFCFEPSYASLPTPPISILEPQVPICFSDYKFTGRHTCSRWELDAYLDSINNYIYSLEQYLSEAHQFSVNFYEDAKEYTECKADEIKNRLR